MRLTLAAALVIAAGPAFAQSAATTQGNAATMGNTGTLGTTQGMGTTPGTPSGRILPGAQTPALTANQTSQTTASPGPSAVQTNNANSRTAAAPVPGANSFTMGEAQRRIASAGFGDVKALKKDGQGIWRGQATKDGTPVSVALDYQGNVVGK